MPEARLARTRHAYEPDKLLTDAAYDAIAAHAEAGRLVERLIQRAYPLRGNRELDGTFTVDCPACGQTHQPDCPLCSTHGYGHGV